jgi:hypothetical protein
MAITIKTLFPENLENYQTFVTDTNPNSTYFKISELPDVLTGGKNAFLIQGSEYLVPDTLIKIEIKDSKGNIIYHEAGEGIVSSSVEGVPIVTEYYEGVSKVVSVHIYPNKTTDINGNVEDGTAYGPATITILGEVSSYINNGLVTPIPIEWEGQYNVKWQTQINVNPSLANTTKIRFYKRPVANITETLSPIYTIVDGLKVQSNIVSSFANIKLSQIDTFAGDVKRIKVFRTSLGDISDADLIQDILVESKELLSTYELSGSVVGNGGLFTSETLEKLWIADGVTTELTSSRIDNGVKLDGSGYFKYSSSLNLSDGNIFELGIDAFYSASTASDLGIYVSGSNNGEFLVSTLNGITPTKNLKDQTISFSLPLAEPTASLYLSQSRGEWHVGNISLKLSQDSAFSPSEVDFVTSMPTVVGNETYKFNFEFYDVNNNYVPVAVTQSAVFTGGNNNIGGTLIFISASASSSAAELAAVSSSISGTIVVTSGSISGSILTLSGSVSGSIVTLSGSVSASITSLSSSVSSSNAVILSSSLSKVQQLANGQYSGSFIGDTVIYSPAIGGQVGYIKELFTVGDNSAATINLDARTTTRKIYIGTGTYDNVNTPIYLDSSGKFSLKSSTNSLTWDGSTLGVNGTINVTGGNAATQTYANTIGTNSVLSGSAAATAVDGKVFTDSNGKIVKSPTTGTAGLYLGSTNLGFHDGVGNWKTYMSNTGNFFLTGTGNNGLSWNGTTLSVTGEVVITSGTTKTAIDNAASAATTAQTTANNASTAATTAQTTANNAAAAVTTVDGKTFTDSSGKLSKTPSVSGAGLYLGSTFMGYYNGSAWKTYMSDNGSFFLSGTSNNGLSWNGTALSIDGNITARNGTFTGNITSEATISGGTITGGTINGGQINGATGTFTGTITATGGTIGQWVIDGGNLRNSANRLILDPNTPSITLKDASGNAKTTIRTGTLSTISSATVSVGASTVVVPAIGISSPTNNTPNTKVNVGDESLGTISAGIYNGAYSYNYISNPGAAVYATTGTNSYIALSVGFDIVRSSDGVIVGSFTHGLGTASIGGGVGSTVINNLGSGTGVFNLNIPTDGVYIKRSWYSYSLSYYSPPTGGSTSGIYSNSFSIPTISFAKVNAFSEITDTGLQIVSSLSRYIRMETGGNFDLDAKGGWRHDSGDVSFVETIGALRARGNLVTTSAGNFSDRRLKENISDYNRGLSDILQMNPKWFQFIDRRNEIMLSGLIAQDVEEVSSEYINEDVMGYKELNYPAVYMTMLNAIKELSNKIDDLESKISGSI